MNDIHILCVDDEPNILRTLQRQLADEPYQIHTAATANAAQQILEHYPIHLLISDYRLPSINGLEMLKNFSSQRPNLLTIILSGFTDTAEVNQALQHGAISAFIHKPWQAHELRATIAELVRSLDTHQGQQP